MPELRDIRSTLSRTGRLAAIRGCSMLLILAGRNGNPGFHALCGLAVRTASCGLLAAMIGTESPWLLPAVLRAQVAVAPVDARQTARPVATVLPFSNISGQPADGWIADGIAETVVGDLERGGLIVVGSGPLLAEAERQGTPLSDGDDRVAIEIGRRLGVAWLVRGGYQRLDDQFRITARVIDVKSGVVVRTAKVDGAVSQIFELQDRIVAELGADLVLTLGATPLSAAAQSVQEAPEVRRLTVAEAVRIALNNNLGVQIARIDPLIEDLGVAQARGAWSPTLTSTVLTSSTDSPSNSFLSGAQGPKTSDERLSTNVGVAQTLPWGGSYSIGWDSSRSTTTNLFSNFSPQLRTSVALTFRQPLLRGFSIDTARQQLLVSRTHREIADVTLQQSITTTTRAVRNAYWELSVAIASLAVQRQSLDLARESLRNTRARVEIGTTPPIDIVEAEAEVAQREESVIVAEAQIGTAEDALRALVYDPEMADFWSIRIEPTELPPFLPVTIDVEAAMRHALDRRTDVRQSRKNLEASDITLRFSRSETLPDVSVSLDYGLAGLGGTQFVRGAGFPGPVIGRIQRGFATVAEDLFDRDFPSWTASLDISYPLGASRQDADLARARLEHSQSQTRLRNEELQVGTEVREAARQVQTNQRRVETTRVARDLAERRLQAEERKFAAGTSTSFFVFQAQRDLSQARNNELRAILDYNRSIVDFEAVQEVPLR